MIRVDVPTPTDPGFLAWQTRATAETARLIARVRAGEVAKIDADLYKGPRSYLLDAFHDKCGYCETRIDVANRWGDLEHYRPKGRVLDPSGKVVKVAEGGVERKHPGYYWLAYDWSNFLPSCPACNRYGADRSGMSSGKRDCFPLEGTFRAIAAGEEKREDPLLLNPRFDDPNQHLVFDPATGAIGYKSRRGEVTVSLLGLNRRGLPESRKNAFLSAVHAALDFMEADPGVSTPEHISTLRERCRACLRGVVEYGAFAKEGVREADRIYTARTERLRDLESGGDG